MKRLWTPWRMDNTKLQTAHFCVHIIFRRDRDTNFMAAVGETRMLPEDLQETYRRIKAAW